MNSVNRAAMALLAGAAAVCSLGAGAQQVYRIVGPDGKVTFSDRPPPDAKAGAPAAVGGGAAPAAGGGGALPFELRNVASRYPVTIYTGGECQPCASGRSYLTSRGIPFTEKTVTTDDDVKALIRIAGEPRLPVLTVGGQQLKGYSEAEWSNYLDAAGYPKSSQLPSAYRNPAASPLVAVQKAPATPVAEETSQAAAPPPPVAAPAPANPSGIRF